MDEISSIAVTREQLGASEPDGLMKLTAEQSQFMKSASPDEMFLFCGNEILKLPKDKAGIVIRSAMDEALAQALKDIMLQFNGQLRFEMDEYRFPMQFISVTASHDATGLKASATARIPDPRAAAN